MVAAPVAGPVRRWRGIAAAIAAISIVGIGLSLQLPLLALALEARGFSRTLIGLNTTVAGLATVATAPFVPALVRRFGLTRTMHGSVAVVAGTLVAFPLVEPVWLWFPLRYLNGAALAILFVASEFWINAVAEEHRRGFVMGVYATVLSLGFAAGPALLFLTGTEGVLPFAAGAMVILAGIIPVLLATGAAPTLGQASGRSLASYVIVAPAATLAAFLFGAVESAGMSFLPLFGMQTGFRESEAALLVSLVALGNVALQIPIGLAADRLDRRVVLLGCALAGLTGSALLPLAGSSLWAAAAILLPWGGAISGLYTVGLTHLGSRFTGSDLAGANAAFVMLYSMGMIFGPIGTGFAMDEVPVLGLPLALGLLFLAYIPVAAARIARPAAA